MSNWGEAFSLGHALQGRNRRLSAQNLSFPLILLVSTKGQRGPGRLRYLWIATQATEGRGAGLIFPSSYIQGTPFSPKPLNQDARPKWCLTHRFLPSWQDSLGRRDGTAAVVPSPRVPRRSPQGAAVAGRCQAAGGGCPAGCGYGARWDCLFCPIGKQVQA